jgi:hypothetical protein
MDCEGMMQQAELDHEQALKAKDKEISVLKARLADQVESIIVAQPIK